LCYKTPNGDHFEGAVQQGLSAAVDRLSEKQDRSIGKLIVSFGGFCRRPVPSLGVSSPNSGPASASAGRGIFAFLARVVC
jgi:hypothetical protein